MTSNDHDLPQNTTFKKTTLYVWFFMLDMRMQTLVSEVEPWLRWATEGEPDAEEIISWSTEVFQYASMTGVISGPILGIFLDKVIIWIENSSLKINNRKINHQTSSYLVSLASMCVIGLVFALISWLLTLGKTGQVDQFRVELIYCCFSCTPV